MSRASWGFWAMGIWAVSAPALGQYFIPEQREPERYSAPGDLFHVTVPTGWIVITHENDPNTVEFRPENGLGDANLFVRRITVPQGAHPKQLMLTGLEQRLRKLPSFREKARKTAKINGKLAAALMGEYYYQGNAQYPRSVEEVYFVDGTDAFVFHFECFAPVISEFAKPLDLFYKTFISRPPKDLLRAPPPPPNHNDIPVDTDRIAY